MNSPSIENIMIMTTGIVEHDPHGLILTLISVLVVFVTLSILYLSYGLIGKIVTSHENRQRKQQKERPSDGELQEETAAAISMALHMYLNETVHDDESYIITIKRKK